MHTNLEVGAQHLLDLQKDVDTERATEKEGKASKLEGLDSFVKEALKWSMERHAKKKRGSRGSGSSGGRNRRQGSGTDFVVKIEVVEDFVAVVVESCIERSARMEWLTKMLLHANHPALVKHPGPENVFVEAALAVHRMKMRNVHISKSKDAPEATTVGDEKVADVDN